MRVAVPARPVRAAEPKPAIEAVRLDDSGSARAGRAAGRGQVTYRVLEAPAPALASSAEKRNADRVRTRLRSGKVLDRHNRFIAECLLHDRSTRGSRLRLHQAVTLPRDIRFYDDERGEIVEAAIVWQRQGEVGIRLRGAVPRGSIGRAELARLSGRYYAVEPGAAGSLRSR